MSVQKIFLRNGIPYEREVFKLPEKYDACIYEVIRIIDGVPLFAEDHMDRLMSSLARKGILQAVSFQLVMDELKQLIELNGYAEGNIRYDVYIGESYTERWAYYIPHSYPHPLLYEKGVRLVSFRSVRKQPAVKEYHADLRRQVEQLLQQTQAYEVVLIDEGDNITEGSKSNLFFIRNNVIYTAPDERVLSGITRKKVLEIIGLKGYELKFEAVKYAELIFFDSAFLTGTSPKVLPVNSIDEFSFEVKHPILHSIMEQYNAVIKAYIDNYKKSKKLI